MIRPAHALAALLLTVALPAFAQAPPPPPGPPGGPDGPGHMRGQRMFDMLDINHDGKLSFDEISGEYRRMLGAADVNGDSAISVEEFRRRGHLIMSVGAMSMFDMLDTNGDGKLTIDEILAPSQRWFKRYDTNGDGAIDAKELDAQMRPDGRGPGPGPGPRR